MAIRQIFLTGLLALCLTGGGAREALAQADLFAPAVYVNDRVITRYEIEQSHLFITALRQPGDPDKVAVERLIDDALRHDAAKANGVKVTPEEVDAGMTEFASRANMTGEQFIVALGQEGIAPETFRAFVEAGLLWRKVVGARFGPRAQAEITKLDIDRALAAATRKTSVQALISELVLRADTPEYRAQAEDIAKRLAGRAMTEGAFAAQAREYSVSQSRGAGGRLDWLPLENLPPPVAAQVLGLAPGQVSQPFPVPNAVVLFYLRDLRETGRPEQQVVAIDWAEFAVASAAEAVRVKGEADTCDDLYGIAKNLPADRLRRETRAPNEVPGDVAMALASLDDNEGTAQFSRGGQPIFLMLCARRHDLPAADAPAPQGAEAGGATAEAEAAPEPQGQQAQAATPRAATPQAAPGTEAVAGPNRDQVRAQLINQRLAAYADAYLAELKANATIRYP